MVSVPSRTTPISVHLNSLSSLHSHSNSRTAIAWVHLGSVITSIIRGVRAVDIVMHVDGTGVIYNDGLLVKVGSSFSCRSETTPLLHSLRSTADNAVP